MLEYNTYVQYDVYTGNMISVPDAEAEQSVKVFNSKPKFDLTNKPSGVSAGTKRKTTQDDDDDGSVTVIFPNTTTLQSKK